MVSLTHIPLFIKPFFTGLPGRWKTQHFLMLQWVIFLQAMVPGPKTIKNLSRYSPARLAEWRFRRLLKAGYWQIHLLIDWLSSEVTKSLPAPEDGTLYLIGDGSEKGKCGSKNPVTQKGRKRQGGPWFFGIRFILLVACWDVYRVPVAFRIILPKQHADYRKENQLFRELVAEYDPPAWAKRIIVTGDAGYGAKENMQLVIEKNRLDKHRSWYFLFALPRTWKQANGKSIKDLVTHLPRKLYKRTWIHPIVRQRRRKTFWCFSKQTQLRHIGDVTVVLSKKGRNVGPKNTKILVTNLPDITARQVIACYQHRWSIEIVFKELKSGLGLGEHQLTKDEKRVENSFGIPILSYLLLLRVCGENIKPGQSWSIFQLLESFRLRVITHQVEHSMKLRIKKLCSIG